MKLKKSFFVFLIPVLLLSIISFIIIEYTIEKECKDKASIIANSIITEIRDEIFIRKKLIQSIISLKNSGKEIDLIKQVYPIDVFFNAFFVFNDRGSFESLFYSEDDNLISKYNKEGLNLSRFNPKEKNFQAVYYTTNEKGEILAGRFTIELSDYFMKYREYPEYSISFVDPDGVDVPFLSYNKRGGIDIVDITLPDKDWKLKIEHSSKNTKRQSIFLTFLFLFIFISSIHYFLAYRFFHLPLKEIKNKSRNLIEGKEIEGLDGIKLINNTIDHLKEKLNLLNIELEGSRNQTLAFNQQLKIYRDELRYANDKLSELEKMKANFISSISHELKTPLVSIVGYTELLASRKLGEINEKQKKAFSTMKRNLDRLKGIIDRLLDYSYLIDPTRDLNLERLSLKKLINDMIEDVKEKEGLKDFEFINKITDDIYVIIDKEKMQQAFFNIFQNAIKFSDETGFIEIGLEKSTDDHVFLYCRDNGIGIKRDEVDKIFERFYQADQGYTKKYGGLGLGLTIVKTVIELHGCEIYIESDKGVGTKVFFSLPVK